MPAEPYKSQHVLYRAIGGTEYAAIVTDVRPDGVDLTTMPPGGQGLYLTRVRYVQTYAPRDGDAVCYPAPAANVLRK